MATAVNDGEWHDVKPHKKSSGLTNGINEEEEPNFSDPEDFIDDVSDNGKFGK